jgi:hypothetical protein
MTLITRSVLIKKLERKESLMKSRLRELSNIIEDRTTVNSMIRHARTFKAITEHQASDQFIRCLLQRVPPDRPGSGCTKKRTKHTDNFLCR